MVAAVHIKAACFSHTRRNAVILINKRISCKGALDLLSLHIYNSYNSGAQVLYEFIARDAIQRQRTPGVFSKKLKFVWTVVERFCGQ